MGQQTAIPSEMQKRRKYVYAHDPTQPSNNSRETLLEGTLPPEVARLLHLVQQANRTQPRLAPFPTDADEGHDTHGVSLPGHPLENNEERTTQQRWLPLVSTADSSTSQAATDSTVHLNDAIDSSFTITDFLSALQANRKQSVPGPDGITYTVLRNLPEQPKLVLLD